MNLTFRDQFIMSQSTYNPTQDSVSETQFTSYSQETLNSQVDSIPEDEQARNFFFLVRVPKFHISVVLVVIISISLMWQFQVRIFTQKFTSQPRF